MLGDRNLGGARAKFAERSDRAIHRGVHVGLGALLGKALAHDAELDFVERLAERLAIRRGRHLALPRIERVLAREHFEQQRNVAHATSHRADMIERRVDTHHAGVRNETVGRLDADDARP